MENSTESREEMTVLHEAATDELSLKVYASPDAMKVFLWAAPVTAGKPVQITRQEILNLISSLNIPRPDVAGIDKACAILALGKEAAMRRISCGTAPQPGREGRYVLMVRKLTSLDAGGEMVAAKVIHAFDNVEAGTAVARIYPPRAGVDGVDALGKPVPAPGGSAVEIKTDDSVEVLPLSEEDGFQTVVSRKAGFLSDNDGVMKVSEELEIPGDVSYRTGDIRFVGKAQVGGDVQKDFSVHARGDIEVKGSTYHATLVSETGSIVVGESAIGEMLVEVTSSENLVRNSLSGKLFRTAEALIQCAGTCKCGVAQGVNIEAGGDIEIAREASHCNLHTKSSLRMPEGHLFGGTIRVVCGVDAKVIGTHSESPTKIILCNRAESSEEYDELMEKIHSHEQAAEVLHLQLGPYADHPARLALLKDGYRDKMQKLLENYERIKKSLGGLKEEQVKLKASSKLNSKLRVSFHEALHRGTTICIDDFCFEPASTLRGPGTIEFNAETKQFAVTEFRPIECDTQAVKSEG